MGTCMKITALTLVALLGYVIYKIRYVPPVPKMENTWWGDGDPLLDNSTIEPFEIKIEDEILAELKHRLHHTRKLTPPLEGVQQQYGINTKLLEEILQFWKTDYNWTERQRYLNKFPQYTVKIQGLKLHYIHVKPQVKKSNNIKTLPLLLLHGWPSSVREFYDIIPLLTTPREKYDFVFEILAPSLPGFAFSQGAVRPGLGATQIAVVFKNFMHKLGYEKFYVHGGDIGGVIAQSMAILFPENILGFHSNLCLAYSSMANLKLQLGSIYPPLVVDRKYEDKVYPLTETFIKTYLLEKGYTHLQATKPDTIGVALTDSPAGLAAYILEKFITWTNRDFKNLENGGLKSKFSYTDLIDNIMLYWVTGSMTTAMRFYAETLNKEAWALGIDDNPIVVPSACARYVNEYYYYPDTILREKFHNLVYTADYDDIGHFAALEAPEIFASDIFKGISTILQTPHT